MKKILFTVIFSIVAIASFAADNDTIIRKPFRIYEKFDIPESINEKVIVKGDTVDMIVQERTFGRFDRGLFNYLYIPKKQWMFGITASYGEFDAADVEILRFIENFNFGGKKYAIRPEVSYFFKSNQCVGLRFDYTRADAELGGLKMNIGEDLSFDISDINYYSTQYTMGVFYRTYVGLGRASRFAVFNEVALQFGSGSSRFQRSYEGVPYDTRTDITQAALNFSPGLSVFMMDNVSFNVSFGVFGLHLTHEKQRTNNVEEGSRTSSGANFKFDLFNINFGFGVHI